MERRLLAHPRRAFGWLLLGACLTYAAYRAGHAMLSPTEGMPADDRSLVGRFVAWPGGAWPPLAAGTLILGTLLLPDGRLEGRWRTRLAVVTAWATIAFAALQLLDDHIMDQAGTPNPLGVEIPYPVQDLLEIAVIAVLAVSLGASLISLRARLVRKLEFEVTDDGVGFDPQAAGYGTGLQGIADRLAALGGELQIRSAPDQGTTVSGRIPGEAAG